MFSWRITKYNPKYRDALEAYTKNEWTSYSDIGRSFDDKKLSFSDYVSVENRYRDSILLYMDYLNIDSFSITQLEKGNLDDQDPYLSDHMIDLYNHIQENYIIDKTVIDDLIRLILREAIWCKLESPNMFVHFGYDYYMYVGASEPCSQVIQQIKELGLFVEEYNSPHSEYPIHKTV